MIRILILSAGIVLLVAAWAVGARSGYEAGAFDAGRTGYRDGYTAGWNASLKACTPWGKWQDRRVVICREIRK